MTLGPQFEQLRMFMTSQEIKDNVNTSMDLDFPQWDSMRNDDPNWKPVRTMPELWDRKLEASKRPYHPDILGSGVYDALQSGKDLFGRDNDVREGTVQIELDDDGNRMMINHHHRVAAQADFENKAMQQWHAPKRLPQQKLIQVEYLDPGENPRNEEW